MRHGLIIDFDFHKKNRWVSALTPYLVNTFIDIFDPVIITTQRAYNQNKTQLKSILMMEPGWAAPFICLDTAQQHIVAVTLSDPHSKTSWFENYFYTNKIKCVLSYFKSPFYYHFPNFPKESFIHFPWAIPDQFINHFPLDVRSKEIAIFGGKNSDAYDVRNWCRDQVGIKNFDISGTENKLLTDREYFKWLSEHDAIIAAGSSNPIYDLVTPKYFEIASSGALLFGQHCADLDDLGFNNTNSVIFTKDNFYKLVRSYKMAPDKYLNRRSGAIKLISEKHTISNRIQLLKKVLGEP